MAKISKRDIKERIENTPIESLLGIPQGIKLTANQKKFAKGVAEGLTKAESYRRAYNSKGKPATVAVKGCNMAKKDNVQVMIEAYKRANELREYQLPEKTRSLLFSELIKHSLDEDFPPAQRVKCLELLGKLSDVGAFTERRESVVIHESSKIRERLLDQLKTIVSAEVKEVKDDEAEQLLAQLMGAPKEKAEDSIPTGGGEGQQANDHPRVYLHNNPNTQSSQNVSSSPDQEPEKVTESDDSDALSGSCKDSEIQDVDFKEKNEGVVTLPPSHDVKRGVGVVEKAADAGWVENGSTPLSDLGTMDKG